MKNYIKHLLYKKADDIQSNSVLTFSSSPGAASKEGSHISSATSPLRAESGTVTSVPASPSADGIKTPPCCLEC